MNKILFTPLFLILLIACKNKPQEAPYQDSTLDSIPTLKGKKEYLSSSYVTAGERLYMVGNQDGSFPEIGWHVKGEMGGIWSHPIKLIDGFEASIGRDTLQELPGATTFLNYPFANEHIYPVTHDSIAISRWQMVAKDKPSLMVRYTLTNTGKASKEFAFNFNTHVDLRPVWLGERTNMIDAQDRVTYDKDKNILIAQDSRNPWVTIIGSSEKPTATSTQESMYKGNGVSGSMTFNISLKAKEKKVLTLVIAGSHTSHDEALASYRTLLNNQETLIKEKENFYKNLADKSKLTIPDKNIEEAFEWLKYNSQWLIQDVPGLGKGVTAGIPDYPWFFGVDSEYALQGYLTVGQFDAVHQTIKLLDSVSNAVNGNGRIIHEMSTNGAVFNQGNINETPQYASLLWQAYKWTGDKDMLRAYFPTVQKGLSWLINERDKDENGFPDGFGMMEIHGMDSEMIDVASYTQKAYVDAGKMAQELDKDVLAKNYFAKAKELNKKINEEFWSSNFNSYADFIGSPQQALHLIDDAIIRADTLDKPWAVNELKTTKKQIIQSNKSGNQPYVVHHNWVVNTPMEVGIADSTKARQALKTARKYINPFGVFVTGIDRDEQSEEDDGSFKGSSVFSYTGAVMTLPTGVLAIAENNYDNPDQALDYLQRMTRSFSYALPGSMYEVSPDYGMMTQAWNIYGYGVPIVRQFFGIDPMAAHKIITIRPAMPTSWEKASIEHVKVGHNSISVFYTKESNTITLKVTQEREDWTLKIIPPKGYSEYEIVQGSVEQSSSDQEQHLLAQGNAVTIKFK